MFKNCLYSEIFVKVRNAVGTSNNSLGGVVTAAAYHVSEIKNIIAKQFFTLYGDAADCQHRDQIAV